MSATVNRDWVGGGDIVDRGLKSIVKGFEAWSLQVVQERRIVGEATGVKGRAYGCYATLDTGRLTDLGEENARPGGDHARLETRQRTDRLHSGT
jgi:hypothetical protein